MVHHAVRAWGAGMMVSNMKHWHYLGRTDDEAGVVDYYVAPPGTPGPGPAADRSKRYLVMHFVGTEGHCGDGLPQYWIELHPRTLAPSLVGDVFPQPVKRPYLDEPSSFHDPHGTNAYLPGFLIRDQLTSELYRERLSPTRQWP
jgi:hypothetical protein